MKKLPTQSKAFLGTFSKSYETMYQLREAITASLEAAPANDVKKPEQHPTFAKSSTCVAIGALWEHLPPDVQADFDNEVLKLLARFGKKMHGVLDATG